MAVLYETDPSYDSSSNCRCTNTAINWQYQVPSIIGNDYFCDTGNSGPGFQYRFVYSDDPLWDGEGCGPTNACCQLNNPPWFCKTLPQATTDDIELRICNDDSIPNEDTLVTFIEIFIM